MEMLEKITYSTPQLQVLWFEAEEILSSSRGDNIVDTEIGDNFTGDDW